MLPVHETETEKDNFHTEAKWPHITVLTHWPHLMLSV